MRDEVLNGEEFDSLLEAQVVIGNWVVEYNTVRPHRGLGMMTPAAFAARQEGPEVRATPHTQTGPVGRAHASTKSTTLNRRGPARTINRNGPNPGAGHYAPSPRPATRKVAQRSWDTTLGLISKGRRS